jgi:hypothetical protein
VVGADHTVCKVRGEQVECGRVDTYRRLGRIMGGDPALDLPHLGECPVPARFELASHQPVGRVRSIVLPEGAVGGVACRFQIAAKRVADLIQLPSRL